MVGHFMSVTLVLLGTVIAVASGIPGLLSGRTSMWGQSVTTLLAALAGLSGLAGIATFWITDDRQPIAIPWSIPGGELNSVGIDGISAMFLLPIFLISLLGSLFGLAYWKQNEHPQNGRKLRLFYGTLTAGMALLVIARHGILFLFGWEIMALSAFFLVTTEAQKKEARDAGWIYLVAAHMATLCLFALFALLRAARGSFALVPLDPDSMTPALATAAFTLGLIGFGLKAGIMPLHVWLPSSHAIAPSHVSAIMSGVIIKMGIYGLVRLTSLLPDPPFVWGATVLSLGVVSGVLGVAFAIGQHDLKRLLAYHSIENIGIISIGLGLALVGRSLGHPDWMILGLSGALLHVWNHAFFKALLFLSAGSVIHATHTREIDQLGGLAKTMPWTSLCFLVGAVAICGLPPLNGFVSELLIYLGLFGSFVDKSGSPFVGALLAAPALALIGGLAVACFVKVYGTVFLGTLRSEHARQSHECSASMRWPMGVLVACCLFIGLAPTIVAPILARAISDWEPSLSDAWLRLGTLAPLPWITAMGLTLIVAWLFAGALLRPRLRGRFFGQGATWGCGYAHPTARMQYTSSSFAQILVGLFAWALRPRYQEPHIVSLFPQESGFHSEVSDPVLDEAVLPTFSFGGWLFARFRLIQGGSVQTYLLYIFVALIVLLFWR
jgi:hydrogenase-4 component B